MKASELIVRLAGLLSQHGDKKVFFSDSLMDEDFTFLNVVYEERSDSFTVQLDSRHEDDPSVRPELTLLQGQATGRGQGHAAMHMEVIDGRLYFLMGGGASQEPTAFTDITVPE